jgi:hypothetical protein
MVGLKCVYMAKLSFGSYPHMPGGGGENISAPKIHIGKVFISKTLFLVIIYRYQAHHSAFPPFATVWRGFSGMILTLGA